VRDELIANWWCFQTTWTRLPNSWQRRLML
jgi:hypothetical protein